MAEHRELTAEELDRVLTWSVVRVARFAGQRLAERLAARGERRAEPAAAQDHPHHPGYTPDGYYV